MSEEKQKDYKKLVEKIEKVLQDKEEQNKLHIEYAHLFLLPEGVKPYESVYLGQKSMIYQEPWESVKAFYQDNNMKLDENQLYPEDHISVELAFMSYLIDQNIDEKIQQDFLQQHILRWVPKFLNDLYENSFAKFYKIVAKHGIGFIEEEKKWISYLNS
ncbi:molecular chaperone TorD family protein [Schnuerera sp.]|uniref:TorD/DmsD family molecular chaperone n=1 Tax=Schnuerera sp. TaxID=2794844 RepID=UPI002CC8C631|nr:molecular chaperone TorD family protein [Schnuerera sp.]HSH34977.1 molecular chaperone TorD family protein [Schnuerera sp.]